MYLRILRIFCLKNNQFNAVNRKKMQVGKKRWHSVKEKRVKITND